jgi:predicted negative regulator of RcsB-dependent stress response
MSWKFIFFVAIAIAGWVGWYIWKQVPETPVSQTLPGYTKALQRSQAKAETVASNANVLLVQEAVNKYRALKGSTPASLQDLVPELIDHIPGGVVYDPATGTVSAAQ